MSVKNSFTTSLDLAPEIRVKRTRAPEHEHHTTSPYEVTVWIAVQDRGSEIRHNRTVDLRKNSKINISSERNEVSLPAIHSFSVDLR